MSNGKFDLFSQDGRYCVVPIIPHSTIDAYRIQVYIYNDEYTVQLNFFSDNF
jgi:hypothetical protein